MYDTIIIGQGPAGITAGIYAVRREMKTLIIGKEPGGQIIWASEIENYPGFITITNFELIDKFNEHAIKSGVEIKNTEVTSVQKREDGIFVVETPAGTFEAKTVIAAMGLAPRRLSVPGEMELSGRGVSYCANCDGPLYKGKTVAVVGSGNSAFDAAEVMSKIAAKVYLVVRGSAFKAFDALVKEVQARPNIEVLTEAQTLEIKGENKVEFLVYKNAKEEIVNLPLDGVFVEIGRIASTDLLRDFVERDQQGQILADDKQETKTPGLFAAGDVVHSEYKQITIAMGQATVAALSAYQYIQQQETKKHELVK
ncbi:thioredoxin-disulfide reductase [Candidatus Falkowbacteria bacterium HGW-Falkowbacteria-2]|uniref:Thioredoxin-disulfide reductase n=1 Tax=Candidatus Falkowbacteria bacterium HGW-Falkowbacteria-2 TaxID=2013769 RepID=A0A2N2E3I9_9BACT|nr:MAG: thioredoxin-disulfide reductase [Candidatus Falkowbacteria bacterium HGW-Falkowbacteria-2]